MATKKKSWQEKLVSAKKPITKQIDKQFADMPAGCTMHISDPLTIKAYIEAIPTGHSVDLTTLRKDLAAENNADYTCPVTTSIFTRIVAEAAYEALECGASIDNITPFWRAMDNKSKIANKLTFGTEFVGKMRANEGIA